MNEAFSVVLDLGELQTNLSAFYVGEGNPVDVKLTIDDQGTLTIERASPRPLYMEGKTL